MTRPAVWHMLLALFAVATASLAGEVTMPFNGKDLSGWKTKQPASRSHWVVGTAALAAQDPSRLVVKEGGAELINAKPHGVDIYTEAQYGDVIVELEAMVPKGSNSGIYLMGEYEVQVFDSYGKETLGEGDMGAIYGAAGPRVNACKAPGEWQKYRIDFRAPRFARDGKKTANARFVRVTLNGQVLHQDVPMKGPSGGGVKGKEAGLGPLMFQGNHGAVAYRNIKITPVEASQ